MKRMIIFMTLCFALLGLNASAEECIVTELGVSLTFPDGYSVMTRETVKNGSIPDDMGMSLEMMEEYLVENNIYLHAVSPDYTNEVILTAEASSVQMEGLADSTLEVIAEELVLQYEANATPVASTEIDTTGNGSYIVFRFQNGSLQYYTAGNGKTYQLTMRPTDGDLTAKQEEELKSAAHSMQFTPSSQALATEMPPTTEVYKGERDIHPGIPIAATILGIIFVSAIVFIAMKPKRK